MIPPSSAASPAWAGSFTADGSFLFDPEAAAVFDFEEAGDGDVVHKVMADLGAKGVAVTEPQLRLKMDELMVLAIAQVKAGT